jgi:hypothetical protein
MLRNLVGRELTVFADFEDETGVVLPPDGPGARYSGHLATGRTTHVHREGVAMRVVCATGASRPLSEGDFQDLPPPQAGVVYLVPYPVEVAGCAAGRRDLLRLGPLRPSVDGGRPLGAEGLMSSLPDWGE